MIHKTILLLFWWHIFPLVLYASDYYVATTGLNIRNGPGKEFSIVYNLQKGDQVELLSKHDNWYKIEYLGISGYVNSNYLRLKEKTEHDFESYFIGFLVIVGLIGVFLLDRWLIAKGREIRREQRRDYYVNTYLQSEEWQRKRYLVLKRDNWRCVYCGDAATQVHHKRYAKRNIGKEPIHWLVSVCRPCHESIHDKAKPSPQE